MKYQIHTTARLIVLFLNLVVLAACGDSEIIPAPGTWRGDDLSFSVTEDSEMTDFSWTIQKEAGPYLNCPIKIPDKSMIIVDGMTKIAEEFDTEPPTWFDLQVVFNTEKTAVLSYDYNVCPSTSISALDENGKEVVYQGESIARWDEP